MLSNKELAKCEPSILFKQIAHVVAIIFVLPKISSINVNLTSKKIKNKN